MNLKELEAKFELKELVDIFSTLSDTKSVHEQTLLFTENSLIEVYMDGKKTFDLHGRKEIEDAFTAFLAPFKHVYHQGGQQIITELTDTTAKGTSYCLVALVSEENGKKTVAKHGVTYFDEFVKIDGKWYFEKRISNFVWTTEEVQEINDNQL
ncbi:nuclear transport factor 2 family protein [Fusobacterium simiae]|uniref:Nuclear transport factor 2 family protein n=1 Tax=Fusobacterium simiae TaxID=855 RepID=A0ABT4DK30_FUSSI|nr:nuclear transport factor 2 family protein [Fusobacterium simiae]MCY7008953.1 nuclear transport factor 2 family protein [Fusobacterium simiae]